MSTDQPIIEEETQDDGKVTEGKSSFSRKMGNALRRSKRLMSGRKKQVNEEKENISPISNDVITESNQEPERVADSNVNGELSPKRSQTFFSSEKQVEIDGKRIKEVEIVGAKSVEPIDMKKQKKLVRKKSLDQSELNIACRDLGKADYEGWLLKKGGGHGIVPVSWKRYWCVVKGGKIYCYKTSFDIAADYAVVINAYTVEKANEKKKIVFRLKPNTEDYKQTVFAGESDDDVNAWVEVMNKVISGIDISKSLENDIPDYEDRKRLYSNAQRSKDDPLNASIRKQSRHSSAFQVETETTGMPAGFGARTSSTSQPRVRKMSSGSAKPESCLAVGSMFKALEDEDDDSGTPTKDVQLKDILYKEVTITPSSTPDAERRRQADLEKLNAEIAKLNSNVGVVNKDVENKSDSPAPKAVVHAAPIPTVEIQEASPVEEAPKGKMEVNEESVQLEVKDGKKTQERSTSQIFRDFESATADDPAPEPIEVVEHRKDTGGTILPQPDQNNEEELVEALPRVEKPLIEEEELIETRKSAEIDAETVITELEEQVKKERSVEIENSDSNEAASKNTELTSESNESPAAQESNQESTLDAEPATEPSETVKDEVSEVKNNESVSADTKENEVSVPVVESSGEENKPDASKESHEQQDHEFTEDAVERAVNVSTDVNVEEKVVNEVSNDPEVSKVNVESVNNVDVDETKPLVGETNETAEEKVNEDVNEETKQSNEVNDTNEIKSVIHDEPVNVEESGTVEKTETVVMSVSIEKTETVEESGAVLNTEIIEESETVEKNETIEESGTVEKSETMQTSVTVEKTEAKEVNETEEASDGGVETTEILTIRETAKTDSVDLGEDLDIPNLSVAESSLSDEINIELNSPTIETKTISEQSTQESKQLNGGANHHVVSVN